MHHPAAPPPAVTAAPWLLIAIAVAWLCGYTATRDFICPACHAHLVEREAGFASFGGQRLAVGRTRTVMAEPDLAGFVDPDCSHESGRAAERFSTDPRGASPVTIAGRWLSAMTPTRRGPLLRGSAGDFSHLFDVVGPPYRSSRKYTRADLHAALMQTTVDTTAWEHGRTFRTAMIQRPAFRASVRLAIDAGDVRVEDVRWLLIGRDDAERLEPSAEERRRLYVARALLDSDPATH